MMVADGGIAEFDDRSMMGCRWWSLIADVAVSSARCSPSSSGAAFSLSASIQHRQCPASSPQLSDSSPLLSIFFSVSPSSPAPALVTTSLAATPPSVSHSLTLPSRSHSSSSRLFLICSLSFFLNLKLISLLFSHLNRFFLKFESLSAAGHPPPAPAPSRLPLLPLRHHRPILLSPSLKPSPAPLFSLRLHSFQNQQPPSSSSLYTNLKSLAFSD